MKIEYSTYEYNEAVREWSKIIGKELSSYYKEIYFKRIEEKLPEHLSRALENIKKGLLYNNEYEVVFNTTFNVIYTTEFLLKHIKEHIATTEEAISELIYALYKERPEAFIMEHEDIKDIIILRFLDMDVLPLTPKDIFTETLPIVNIKEIITFTSDDVSKLFEFATKTFEETLRNYGCQYKVLETTKLSGKEIERNYSIKCFGKDYSATVTVDEGLIRVVVQSTMEIE